MLALEKNRIPAKPKWRLAKLGIQDLDAVYAFECAAWPKELQASRETLATRFRLDHYMLGAWQDKQLIGLASWRYGLLDPADKSSFPKTFNTFSGSMNSHPYNAAFVYNLSIHPEKRGTAITRAMILAVIKQAGADGCRYLVGDGRCPSYNGSNTTIEQIACSTIFRNAINRLVENGQGPSLDEYLADPLLLFYYRILDCTFLWTIPNFLPDDVSSGGHRVIFYKHLHSSS